MELAIPNFVVQHTENTFQCATLQSGGRAYYMSRATLLSRHFFCLMYQFILSKKKNVWEAFQVIIYIWARRMETCSHLQIKEWVWLRAHINVKPLLDLSQYRGPPCIVWLYYAHSYTVALSPGIIPSFAVLHTEKLEGLGIMRHGCTMISRRFFFSA